MKKTLSIISCIVLVLAMAACGGNTEYRNGHVEGTLSEIFKQIYNNANVESPIVIETVVNNTNVTGMLGSDKVTFIEGLSSDAAIMSIPHSLVLIRVDENTDITATKKLIKDNVDPRKWICAGVEDDQVIVDNIGDLIILIMSADAQAYHDSFKALVK